MYRPGYSAGGTAKLRDWPKDEALATKVEIYSLELTLYVCLAVMADPRNHAADGYSFRFFSPEQIDHILRAATLSRELALVRADGSLRHFLARLARIDLLVIDDWAMAPLNERERREVWEICEDRYQTRSTVLTSQLPVSRWHEQIGDPTIADGILDRLVHNAHRIEMRGESMRKKRNPPQDEKKE